MSDVSSFTVSYDRRADTLYITQPIAAVRGVQDKSGIIWRYDASGKLIGVTVMDFVELWKADPNALAAKIAERFDMPIPQASIIVNHALGLRSTH